MTYNDYQSAVSGAAQKWAAIFDTEEQRKVFVDALKAGGDAIRELELCRNELCLQCGRYRNAHEGACDECRWKR